MKTSELMIGDWVLQALYKDVKIPNKGHGWKEVRVNCLPFDEDWAIEPIPLTGDILKVNGFENYIDDYGNPSLRLKGTDDANDVNGLCYIDWTPKGHGCRGKLFDGFLYILMNVGSIHRPCKFVHELQHALRLCGLNDIADNFKIKL